MPYLYATEDQDFSDYAGGRVIYSQPGAPAFPVRLASEIFQRARRRLSATAPVTLYDPTCGGAYHLTALGLLHGEHITRILASDIDPHVLDLAKRNLGLLSMHGLGQRERELQRLLITYGKSSHIEALESLARLRARLAGRSPAPAIETRVFFADALDATALKQELVQESVQLVFCDLPYGQLTRWQGGDDHPHTETSPVWRLLDALQATLPPPVVVALAADKTQKLAHPAFHRLERFQVGKRQVSLLAL